MQSELQPTSQETITEARFPENNDSSTQHGFEDQPGVRLQSAARSDATILSQKASDYAAGVANASRDEAGRLSSMGNTLPLKNRVEEYENITSPPRSSDTGVFKVTSTSNASGCPISSVPSGQSAYLYWRVAQLTSIQNS